VVEDGVEGLDGEEAVDLPVFLLGWREAARREKLGATRVLSRAR